MTWRTTGQLTVPLLALIICKTISAAPLAWSRACWYKIFCFSISFSWNPNPLERPGEVQQFSDFISPPVLTWQRVLCRRWSTSNVFSLPSSSSSSSSAQLWGQTVSLLYQTFTDFILWVSCKGRYLRHHVCVRDVQRIDLCVTEGWNDTQSPSAQQEMFNVWSGRGHALTSSLSERCGWSGGWAGGEGRAGSQPPPPPPPPRSLWAFSAGVHRRKNLALNLSSAHDSDSDHWTVNTIQSHGNNTVLVKYKHAAGDPWRGRTWTSRVRMMMNQFSNPCMLADRCKQEAILWSDYEHEEWPGQKKRASDTDWLNPERHWSKRVDTQI